MQFSALNLYTLVNESLIIHSFILQIHKLFTNGNFPHLLYWCTKVNLQLHTLELFVNLTNYSVIISLSVGESIVCGSRSFHEVLEETHAEVTQPFLLFN